MRTFFVPGSITFTDSFYTSRAVVRDRFPLSYDRDGLLLSAFDTAPIVCFICLLLVTDGLQVSYLLFWAGIHIK
jgi:hypothetical protein